MKYNLDKFFFPRRPLSLIWAVILFTLTACGGSSGEEEEEGDNSVVNVTPVAEAQSVTTMEGTAVAITLVGTDADGDTLTYNITSQPANGDLTETAPNLIYTPINDSFVGNDSFTFTVNDGTDTSSTAIVNITVAAVSTNTAPQAMGQLLTMTQGTNMTITLTGTDVDNDPLTYAIVNDPANGSLTGTAPNLIYTPINDGFVGNDNFTFTVNDGTDTSNSATVAIEVTAASPITITTTTLPDGKEGDVYSQALAASGANSYDWQVVAGNLPDGLTLNGSSIGGTPTVNGTFEFTVEATDSNNTARTDHQSFTLLIAQPDSNELAIVSTSLTGAVVGQDYNESLNGSGGESSGYTWSWDQGNQVAGLSLNTNGTISGIATGDTSSYPVNITLSDGSSSVSRPFTLQVTDTSVASVCQDSGAVIDMSLDGPASSPQIGINLTTNRISGIAPLSVFFDAANTTHTDNNVDPFLDLHYQWYFHDTAAYSSGTWKYSCKSKNLATGPLAAHIFDDPGTYQVRLTVMDRNGNQTSTTVDITVESPESLTTYCVADVSGNGGDFMGCPLDTNSDGNCDVTPNQCVDESNAVTATNGLLSGGNQVLFRRGDIFDAPTVGFRITGNQGILGSFGAAEQPNPVWQFQAFANPNDQVTALRFKNAFDWRFMDIDLIGDNTFSETTSAISMVESRNILQYRIDMRHWKNLGGATHERWDNDLLPIPGNVGLDFFCENLFFVDIDYSERYQGTLGGWAIYFQMENSAVMGVFIESQRDAEGIYRSKHSKKVLIQHNRFEDPGASKQNISLRTCEKGNSLCTPSLFSEDVIISDNVLISSNDTSPIQITPGPQGRHIIERNFIHYDETMLWTSLMAMQLGPDVTGVVVRNNILDMTLPSITGNGASLLTGANDLKVYNNTLYWNNDGGHIVTCFYVVNGLCSNNLVYGLGPEINGDIGSGTVAENNLSNVDFSGSPFPAVITEPPLPQQFVPVGSQMPSGTTLVAPKAIDDFFGNIRPLDSISVGAAEYQ